MREIALIISFLIGSILSASAQEWRDSLSVARKAYENKEYGKAYRYYKSAQSKAPEGIDLSEEMGQSAYKNQQYEDAAAIYEQKASTDDSKKKKADNYHNLGNTRMRQKDYQGAVDAYKQALRNNPKDEQTRYNLSEALRELRNQNQQNQKDQQDQQDQNNQNQPNQNQGNQGNQPPQNNGQSGSSGSNNSNDGQPGTPGQGTAPKLQDKAVDKKLDELMKQEAETKRKLGGSRSGQGSARSGKDW